MRTVRSASPVAPGVQGYLRCSPPALPNLVLSTFVSTKGRTEGENIANEHVTPVTTMIAEIIAAEAPADPQARKMALLEDVAARNNPAITLLADGSTVLYNAMLIDQVDVSFGDDGESADPPGGDEGSASGDAGMVAPFRRLQTPSVILLWMWRARPLSMLRWLIFCRMAI